MRHLILLVFSLLFFINTYSQKFEGGAFIGVVGAQIDGDQYAGYNKPGLTFGGFVAYPFGDRFWLQTEMKLIMKGATRPAPVGVLPYSVSLYYFEMPYIGRYKLTKQIFLEAGLTIAFLAYSVNDLGEGPIAPDPPFNKTDFNILSGLYYAFNDHISINLRFQYSIIPVRGKPVSPFNYWNNNQYNNMLSMSLYYSPKLKKN